MYVGLGQEKEPTPVRVVPPPPPPKDPWVEDAGYQRCGDAYPVYRWVPPVAFNNPEVSRSRAWGESRFGPAYRGSASRECPTCMQGLGAYYQAQQNATIPLSGMVSSVLPVVGAGLLIGLGVMYFKRLPG